MAFYPSYPVCTERLTLRPFTRGDVDAVYSYRRRDDVARFLFDIPLSRDECALAVQNRINQVALQSEGDRLILGVELSHTGELIGEVSLIWRSVDWQQGEVGWIFCPDHQGRGYATEAANKLFDLAFGSADLHRLTARCDIRNEKSWRLMERLGMRREAHFREQAIVKGRWDEEYVYAMLWGEWKERRSDQLGNGINV